MKKLLAIFLALGMILAFSNPQAVFAGDDNWFADSRIPIDIPYAG